MNLRSPGSVLLAAGSLCLSSCSGSGGKADSGPDASVPQCLANSNCPTGLLCDLSSGTGICRLPGELEECSPDAGCAATNAVCAPIPYLLHACLYPCLSTADCPDPVTSCQTEPGSGQLLCLPTSCGDAGLWGPCSVQASGDGLCILGGTFGSLCLAGGSATADAGCSLARPASATAALCSPGTACTFSDGGQLCLPVCGTGGDGGPGCLPGSACVSFSGGPVAGFASFGYCAQTCDPGGHDCPGGTDCIDYVQTPVCWP